MGFRASLGAAAPVAALLAALSLATVARAFDETRYPDFSGVWRKPVGIGNQWDQTKPLGRAQEPPFTPEYQAVFEASLADQKAGGQGNDAPSRCVPFAMPRVMTVVFDMEIVITPATTYILFAHSMPRRIVTEGRDWPKEIEPSFAGYSIGKWEDTDGDGRFDTLVAETRAIKGPHSYDSSGIPFHEDGRAIVRERITSDKANPSVLHNEITAIDSALTQPWTVQRSYRRLPAKEPIWSEYVCSENNRHVQIGSENYVLGADGLLMPTRKNQSPPDLRHFQ